LRGPQSPLRGLWFAGLVLLLWQEGWPLRGERPRGECPRGERPRGEGPEWEDGC
jgi:hypothetical protein